MPHFLQRLVITLVCALSFHLPPGACAERIAPTKARADAVAFTLDAGRILMEVGFRKPDGGLRKALAWFNMGMASPTLAKALYRDLRVGAEPLRIEFANAAFEISASDVTDGDGGLGAPTFEHLFAPHPVEAMLPASILRDYAVTIDYARRTLALARGGGATPDGVAVPLVVNDKTGLATVDVTIAGDVYPFVIDAGSGYTWMRGAVLKQWLAAHPDWRRAEGAIGLANNNMLDYSFEKEGTIARVPELVIGSVSARNVGVLGTAPVFGALDGLIGDVFWDNWQKSASGPVVGWLGGNVLGNFKLTLDYTNRVSYWRAEAASNPHDLDQIGVTLVRRDARYFIGGLVRPAGNDTMLGPAVQGVAPGDELVGVGSFEARGAGKAALLAALAGKPGEMRLLRLERNGLPLETSELVLDLR